MSLERRITDALHAADNYQPSVDLFSRVHQSIEEDTAHRRRVRNSFIGVACGLTLLVVFFGNVATRPGTGQIVVPRWSLEVASTAIGVAVLIGLGPALRRLGGPLLMEVFHLSPVTGLRFSRLLEIAYYLYFGGSIIGGFDPRSLSVLVEVPGEDVMRELFQIGGFLLEVGLAHMANLALLPVVGLLFTSLTRRARRREAGSAAPTIAPRARRADRMATVIVMTATGLALVGALAIVAMILLGLGSP